MFRFGWEAFKKLNDEKYERSEKEEIKNMTWPVVFLNSDASIPMLCLRYKLVFPYNRF